MSTFEKTPLATALCLALVVAGFALFVANFEWPTSRIVRAGFPIGNGDILIRDVIPIVIAGYAIGLGAIAITRFVFPKSGIKTILYVVAACAGLAALPLLALSVAISGTPTIRDLGAVAMVLSVPLAVATWAAVASLLSKRQAR